MPDSWVIVAAARVIILDQFVYTRARNLQSVEIMVYAIFFLRAAIYNAYFVRTTKSPGGKSGLRIISIPWKS